MTLATATPDGRPSARAVVLRGFDESGFVFYTDARSRKATELEANPRAALVFLWSSVDRQVRIEGDVSLLSGADADEHFASRPRDVQLAIQAMRQDEVVPSRVELQRRLREVERDYHDAGVRRPPHWVGYRLRADAVEFWEQQPDQLHERVRYRLVEGSWLVERLAP